MLDTPPSHLPSVRPTDFLWAFANKKGRIAPALLEFHQGISTLWPFRIFPSVMFRYVPSPRPDKSQGEPCLCVSDTNAPADNCPYISNVLSIDFIFSIPSFEKKNPAPGHGLWYRFLNILGLGPFFFFQFYCVMSMFLEFSID